MSSNASTSAETFQRRIFWIGVALVCLVLTTATLRSRRTQSSAGAQSTSSPPSVVSTKTNPSNSLSVPIRRPLSVNTNANPISANETVALLLQRFAENRRGLLQQFANRLGINVPSEFQAFFDAVAANKWEDIDPVYSELSALRHREDVSREFLSLWPVIHETLGVAEVVHEWPAQALLDYGQLVLNSVPPGGVYVGGTDEGRFIPTLLNASAEEPKILLTQNALADATYMEYIRFQYDSQFKLPTENQTQEAFRRIVEKYGEKQPDGRVTVSGQDAVMAINSLLLEQMAKDNPNRAFAVQESIPLKDTYAQATLTGPLYVFGAEPASKENSRPTTTPSEIVTFWQGTVSQLQSAPNSEVPDITRASYAKLATGQANILTAQGNTREAEQTLRLANQLDPSLPDATYPLVDLYLKSGRASDALAVVEQAIAQSEKSPSSKRDALKGFRELRTQLLNPKP